MFVSRSRRENRRRRRLDAIQTPISVAVVALLSQKVIARAEARRYLRLIVTAAYEDNPEVCARSETLAADCRFGLAAAVSAVAIRADETAGLERARRFRCVGSERGLIDVHHSL